MVWSARERATERRALMIDLIIFAFVVGAMIAIIGWYIFCWAIMLMVLVAAAPAIGLAVGLIYLGMPQWAAILVSFLVFAVYMGAWDERRQKRKNEPKGPGPDGIAGREAADTARRTRARLASR